jgi:hypothetical protein
MILGEDYSFMDSLKTDTVAIKLLTGPYKDIVYRYKELSVKEAHDKSYATMVFDYELFDMAAFTETTLRKDKLFETHVGLVLNALLLEAVDATDHQKQLKESNGLNRKGDSEELIEE